MKRKHTEEVVFEIVYNSFFGVRFINHLGSSPSNNIDDDDEPQQTYMDIDLDLSRLTDKLFLVMHDQRMYVTSGGLSFVDIIYAGEFNAGPTDQFQIEFDTDYIYPASASLDYRYEILPTTDEIPASLQNQIGVIRKSLMASKEEIE